MAATYLATLDHFITEQITATLCGSLSLRGEKSYARFRAPKHLTPCEKSGLTPGPRSDWPAAF
jgi:hypothetical protein